MDSLLNDRREFCILHVIKRKVGSKEWSRPPHAKAYFGKACFDEFLSKCALLNPTLTKSMEQSME
uniref:Uncharacterized protein n=1 Tax=Romanomermis culicivorax TaxID=13658 RepID=A0A915JZ10_ROMCU